MLYTSELAAQALKLAPVGSAHTANACACAMCGRPIGHTDLSSPTDDLPRSFTDFVHLGTSGWICGWCKSTTPQDVMRYLQRCVITRHGIYSLNTDRARAWFWMTPPEPPFSVVIQHSSQATFHHFWRTPVTLDARLVTASIEGAIYQIRRQRLLKAIEMSALLVKRAETLHMKKGQMKSPFVVLLRDPTDASSNHGRISSVAHQLAHLHDDCKEAVRYLENLLPGELCVLSAMVKAKPEEPEMPELVSQFVK